MRSRRPGPCLLAARHHSDFEERMSKHIDDQAERTVTGAAGNMVRGELAALTRRMTAHRRILFRQRRRAPSFRRARGSPRPTGGIRESRTTVCAGPAGLHRHDRSRPHARLLRTVHATPGAIAAVRQSGRRRAAAVRCRRRSGPRGQCDRRRSGRRRARRRGRRRGQRPQFRGRVPGGPAGPADSRRRQRRRGGCGRERRGAVAVPAQVRGTQLGAVDGAARDLRPGPSPPPPGGPCGTASPGFLDRGARPRSGPWPSPARPR